MKFCYFLQTLKQVPLGYDFSLYTYGPFAAAILDDLAYTQRLGAVEERVICNPNGYGYEITAGCAADEVKGRSQDFLTQYGECIDWVVREFGGLRAGDLELASTMVYVDQEARQKGEAISLPALVERVLEIKPRFTQDKATELAEDLVQKQFLSQVTGK